MTRALATEHRSLRAALARLEEAVAALPACRPAYAEPADVELARAAAHARVVLARVSAIGNPGRPPKDAEAHP